MVSDPEKVGDLITFFLFGREISATGRVSKRPNLESKSSHSRFRSAVSDNEEVVDVNQQFVHR